MAKLLISTGFGLWGDRPRNRSWDCLEAVAETLEINGWILEARRLPVAWKSVREAAAEIAAKSPDAVVCFGQSARPEICLERMARAENSPSKRDIRDETAPLESGEPRASTLPLDAIALRLDEAGIPRAFSDHAGDYLCNFLFCRVLAELAYRASGAPIPAGFVHVPEPGSLTDAQVQSAMRLCLLESAAAGSVSHF